MSYHRNLAELYDEYVAQHTGEDSPPRPYKDFVRMFWATGLTLETIAHPVTEDRFFCAVFTSEWQKGAPLGPDDLYILRTALDRSLPRLVS